MIENYDDFELGELYYYTSEDLERVSQVNVLKCIEYNSNGPRFEFILPARMYENVSKGHLLITKEGWNKLEKC